MAKRKCKRCRTCKNWARHTQKFDIEHHGKHVGICSSKAFVYTGQSNIINVDGLGYWDVESYHAGFETGEDFGCIHWDN